MPSGFGDKKKVFSDPENELYLLVLAGFFSCDFHLLA